MLEFQDFCPACGQSYDTPQVWEGQVAGRWWYTDGVILVRGAWPGRYDTRPGYPDVASLLAKHDAAAPPPCTGTSDGQYVTLSTGTKLDAEWWPELVNGRELTPHHAGGLEPVIFRDAAGAIAAVVMPVKTFDVDPSARGAAA